MDRALDERRQNLLIVCRSAFIMYSMLYLCLSVQ